MKITGDGMQVSCSMHALVLAFTILDGNENPNLPSSNHTISKKYGCIYQPLFPSIPIDRVIPDILHLFLRISDILINLLILELKEDGWD